MMKCYLCLFVASFLLDLRFFCTSPVPPHPCPLPDLPKFKLRHFPRPDHELYHHSNLRPLLLRRLQRHLLDPGHVRTTRRILVLKHIQNPLETQHPILTSILILPLHQWIIHLLFLAFQCSLFLGRSDGMRS